MGAAAAARPWGQRGGWPTLATASSCHLWADLRQWGQGWWAEAVCGRPLLVATMCRAAQSRPGAAAAFAIATGRVQLRARLPWAPMPAAPLEVATLTDGFSNMCLIILKCNLCQKKKKKNMQRYLPHTLKKKTRVECACGP